MTFQRLRDYVDAINCSALPSFSRDCLHQGFNKTMAAEAKEKFKINKVFLIFKFAVKKHFNLKYINFLETSSQSIRNFKTTGDRFIKRARVS